MQHHLSSQFEVAWAVADLVALHGTRDDKNVAEPARSVVTLAGLSVYCDNQMPVRFVADDLDVVIDREDCGQPFENWLQGSSSARAVQGLVNARYTFNFRYGDLSALRAWRTRLDGLIAATPRKAA